MAHQRLCTSHDGDLASALPLVQAMSGTRAVRRLPRCGPAMPRRSGLANGWPLRARMGSGEGYTGEACAGVGSKPATSPATSHAAMRRRANPSWRVVTATCLRDPWARRLRGRTPVMLRSRPPVAPPTFTERRFVGRRPRARPRSALRRHLAARLRKLAQRGPRDRSVRNHRSHRRPLVLFRGLGTGGARQQRQRDERHARFVVVGGHQRPDVVRRRAIARLRVAQLRSRLRERVDHPDAARLGRAVGQGCDHRLVSLRARASARRQTRRNTPAYAIQAGPGGITFSVDTGAGACKRLRSRKPSGRPLASRGGHLRRRERSPLRRRRPGRQRHRGARAHRLRRGQRRVDRRQPGRCEHVARGWPAGREEFYSDALDPATIAQDGSQRPGGTSAIPVPSTSLLPATGSLPPLGNASQRRRLRPGALPRPHLGPAGAKQHPAQPVARVLERGRKRHLRHGLAARRAAANHPLPKAHGRGGRPTCVVYLRRRLLPQRAAARRHQHRRDAVSHVPGRLLAHHRARPGRQWPDLVRAADQGRPHLHVREHRQRARRGKPDGHLGQSERSQRQCHLDVVGALRVDRLARAGSGRQLHGRDLPGQLRRRPHARGDRLHGVCRGPVDAPVGAVLLRRDAPRRGRDLPVGDAFHAPESPLAHRDVRAQPGAAFALARLLAQLHGQLHHPAELAVQRERLRRPAGRRRVAVPDRYLLVHRRLVELRRLRHGDRPRDAVELDGSRVRDPRRQRRRQRRRALSPDPGFGLLPRHFDRHGPHQQHSGHLGPRPSALARRLQRRRPRRPARWRVLARSRPFHGAAGHRRRLDRLRVDRVGVCQPQRRLDPLRHDADRRRGRRQRRPPAGHHPRRRDQSAVVRDQHRKRVQGVHRVRPEDVELPDARGHQRRRRDRRLFPIPRTATMARSISLR